MMDEEEVVAEDVEDEATEGATLIEEIVSGRARAGRARRARGGEVEVPKTAPKTTTKKKDWTRQSTMKVTLTLNCTKVYCLQY